MRLNLGIRRRLAPLLDNDLARIKLANSILLTLIGSPFIYYGDEIGMGDNIWLDDRNGVRTPMQWEPGPNAGFSTAPAEALYAPVVKPGPFGPARVNVQAAGRRPRFASQLDPRPAAPPQAASSLRARHAAAAGRRPPGPAGLRA